MELDAKEARVLLELYTSGGDARWSELKKGLVDIGVMSETTLYLKLKDLKKKDKGYVQRRLIEDEIRWELTPKGMYTALSYWAPHEIGTDEFKRELEKWREAQGFSVTIQELHPEAWWDLVKEAIKHLKVKQLLRGRSEEDFMKHMKSYVDQTQRILITLWPQLLHDLIVTLGWVIAATLVYRAFLPTPLRKEGANKLDGFIDLLVKSLSGAWAENARDVLQGNFHSLEVLVVLNKAIEEGKIEPITREMPLKEIIKKLQERGLLTVEWEA